MELDELRRASALFLEIMPEDMRADWDRKNEVERWAFFSAWYCFMKEVNCV